MSRNLIISGGIFHPFDETSAALQTLFEAVDIQSTIVTDVEEGLAQLGDFDLLTMNCLRWRMIQHDKYIPFRDEWAMELSPAGRTAIQDHVTNGSGLLGVHTAGICFDTWPEWKNVLGAGWQWGTSFHPEISDIHVDLDEGSHPITDGLAGFDLHDEIYHHLDPAPGAQCLLRAEADEGPQSLMWAKQTGSGRSVYDTLGHDVSSITHPVHGRILQRAAAWSLGRSDQDVTAI